MPYGDVLGIIQEIQSDSPLAIEPDWPARVRQTYPKSIASLILPGFDTAYGLPKSFEGHLDARELSWGFDESWSPGVVFNTRIESWMKPTWRSSMVHRRCIMPVTAFYETNQNETRISPSTGRQVKQQYAFQVPGQDVILIGCIWKGDAFSMVTTAANADMEPIHHRMPLIIEQQELPLWFGPDYLSLADRSRIDLCAERA